MIKTEKKTCCNSPSVNICADCSEIMDVLLQILHVSIGKAFVSVLIIKYCFIIVTHFL